MTSHHGARRVGRMARWHRQGTYALLGACALSGLGWFIGLDVFGLPPPELKGWWRWHGILGIAAMLAIGAALPVHVIATWRHGRNRTWGACTLGLMATVVATAIALLYGPGSSRDAMHWAHGVAGVVTAFAFVWHVVQGKRSISGRHGHDRS